MKTVHAAVLALTLAGAANAEVRVEPVEYKQGDTVLRGQIAYDDAISAVRPGVLVVHEWWGLNDYTKTRATMLAKEGYVALAVDMFGEGRTTEHPQEAGEWASAVAQNQAVAKARFDAAHALLMADKRVDKTRIAAIGYCFGGGVVLGMAMGGADLDGVVSFHGSLPGDPATAKVTARILVCHGAADEFIPAEAVATFQKNLAAAGAAWEFVSYGGAKHGFTNPKAGTFGIPALAYHEDADRRSWAAALAFLKDALK